MDGSAPEGFELIACPACDEPRHSPVYSGKDWALPSGLTLHIVRCQACGLAYTNPRPTMQHIGAYYPDEYSPYQRGRGEMERSTAASTFIRTLILQNAYAAPKLRPHGAKKLLASAASMIKSPASCGLAIEYFGKGRLLDFGCGGGTFLRVMQAMGWECTGLDFSEAAVKRVREGGIRAYQGSLPHPELSPGSFDLVAMLHALEHVPRPREILRAAYALLDRDGKVHIQVPNFAGWEIERYGDAANTLDLPRHLLHWEPATLAQELKLAGFVDVKVGQACRHGWLRKSAGRTERYTPRFADRLMRFKPVSQLVAWQCARRGRGNELIASGRKR